MDGEFEDPMAKNNIKTNTTNTTEENTVALVTEPVETVEASAAPIAVEHGIVKASPSEIEVASASWVESVPKPIRALFNIMPAVEPDELTAMVEQLPDHLRANFEALVEGMNPVREGIVSTNTQFKIPEMRLYHGVGDDPARPPAAPVGSIYTSDGKILAAWDKQQAKSLKIDQVFTGAAVFLQETRAWWKPRDKSYVLPPDVDPTSNAPICRSLDRAMGDRYGACPACPHRPYAKGSYDPNGCVNDARLYVVLKDFSAIYAMTLKGASLKKGVLPIQRINGKPWDLWFDFGLSEERNNQGRWFSLTSTPHTTDNHPQGEPSSAAERGVLRALARTILHEQYKPALEAQYTRRATVSVATDAGADMAAIEAAARASGAQDYSKNNL